MCVHLYFCNVVFVVLFSLEVVLLEMSLQMLLSFQASEVLSDQTDLRLAERKERRTDYVMNQWANRNGRVGELIGLLERQQLLRARDVILTRECIIIIIISISCFLSEKLMLTSY